MIAFFKKYSFWFLVPSIVFAGTEIVPKSGEQQSSFGPVAAIGFDKAKSRVSGFYHFKQMQMPDHSFHADCRIFFSAAYNGSSTMQALATDVSAKKQKVVDGSLEIGQYGSTAQKLAGRQVYSLRLNSDLPGCTSAVDVSDSEFQIELERMGDWKAISFIRAKRSYFYRAPDENQKSGAYVVAGNLIYVYDESSDWYYVKYLGEKSETSGWIKKTDTIQLEAVGNYKQ